MAPKSMKLEQAKIVGSEIIFENPDGFIKALQDGCFRLVIPENINIQPGIKLCREFYFPKSNEDKECKTYNGFREKAKDDIYFDREHFQTEHILLDQPSRLRYFPSELVEMCNAMSDLSLLILRNVLKSLRVPEHLWEKVTGGAVEGSGTHWFAASHYRSERKQLGCAPHKDTGFVTVLYIEQPGLEALINEHWYSIDPQPGCFLINFGGALELLTKTLTFPVKAILHRVRQCKSVQYGEDRFSFAAFANPPASGFLYQIYDNGKIVQAQSVEKFLMDFNKTTWKDRYSDFGIARPEESLS